MYLVSKKIKLAHEKEILEKRQALFIGSFHDKLPQKKYFLTTISLILMKIVVCGYPIAKTYWCKYYVSTTNTF